MIFFLGFIIISLVSIFYLNDYLSFKYFMLSFVPFTILYSVVLGFIAFFFYSQIDCLIYIAALSIIVHMDGLINNELLRLLVWYAIFLPVNFITHLIVKRKELGYDKYSIISGIVMAVFVNLSMNMIPYPAIVVPAIGR